LLVHFRLAGQPYRPHIPAEVSAYFLADADTRSCALLDGMSDATPLPTPDEIAERIRACREELAALKKLQRLVNAERAAQEAHARRQGAKNDQRAGTVDLGGGRATATGENPLRRPSHGP
jgi:hypothetical protein